MSYKWQLGKIGLIDLKTGKAIPKDENNRHYQEWKVWDAKPEHTTQEPDDDPNNFGGVDNGNN